MDPRLFFVHVMKTGGTTFRHHLIRQLGADRVYPNAEIDPDLTEANRSVRYLRNLSEERWRRLDAVAVHMPFFASTVVDRPFVTATILRDPVERAVSHLKMRQQRHPDHRGRPLEEIYEDPWVFQLGIHNHQVRVFALRASDDADSNHEPIEIDDARLAEAMDNIARVDLLGLHDRYDEFVDTVHRRFGWRRQDVPNLRVGPSVEVPERLLRRIRDDNEADVEFFERVKKLYAGRG